MGGEIKKKNGGKKHRNIKKEEKKKRQKENNSPPLHLPEKKKIKLRGVGGGREEPQSERVNKYCDICFLASCLPGQRCQIHR